MDGKTLLASTVIAAVVSGVVTLIGSVLTTAAAERRLRREFRLEFSAEDAARAFLMSLKLESRSFAFMRQRLGGFEYDEIRKILVSIGAVRFHGTGGEERWVLWERNRDYVERIDTDSKPGPA